MRAIFLADAVPLMIQWRKSSFFRLFLVLHVCSAQVPSSTCVCLLLFREVSIDIMWTYKVSQTSPMLNHYRILLYPAQQRASDTLDQAHMRPTSTLGAGLVPAVVKAVRANFVSSMLLMSLFTAALCPPLATLCKSRAVMHWSEAAWLNFAIVTPQLEKQKKMPRSSLEATPPVFQPVVRTPVVKFLVAVWCYSFSD